MSDAANPNLTRAPYGMAFDGPSQSGGNDGPMFDIFTNGTGDFVSDLSLYQTQGVRAVLKFVGAPPNYQFSDLSFSMASWKAMMDKAAAKTNAQQMGNFVQAGTLLANWIMDDSKAGSKVFGGKPPTLDDCDEMARYSKSLWSLVPTAIRVDNVYLKQKSNWTYLDFGWGQWHIRVGPVQPWFTNNVNDGRSVGLGFMAGFNLLNGGSGLTAPWNFSPNHQAGSFGMSPMEIDAVTEAVSANTFAIGVYGWAAQSIFDKDDYYHRTDIQAPLARMAAAMAGRVAGPLNWRDKSPSGSTDTGSGSTLTVGGNWAVLEAGTTARRNNGNTLTVAAPAEPVANALQVMLLHSRDTLRTITVPSGWSVGKRVSGLSSQGGELVLCYKLGAATEADVVADFDGVGGQGVTETGRWLSFSGNTTRMAGLLATVGSAATWASQTGMGPIPGLTSTASDALVLICLARCDDFGGGSVDENVMSATTGPQVWQRVVSTGNASGKRAALLVDWAPTSGLASITTKSWSEVSGTAAGAGVGFMVAFAPAAVVAGTAPAMAFDAEDDAVTLAVGSTLSFTIQSTGSTPITYSLLSGPSQVTLGASTGAFQFTPPSVDTYVIVLKAANSFGSDVGSFQVFAVAASAASNHAPTITHPGNKTVTAHDLLSFVVPVSDADGDPVTLRLEAGAPEGTFLDAETGQFIWIPSGEQGPGTYPIVVVASDGRLESRSTFTVTVNDSPWTRTGGNTARFSRTIPSASAFSRI